MRALTQRMLDQSGYDAEANPAIAALADFAAQRSGIEWQNYYSSWSDREGRRAYQKEIRDISTDLRRFRDALNIAASEGVTDAAVIAAVIAAAPRVFSGRLVWKGTTRTNKCGHTFDSSGQIGEACPQCGNKLIDNFTLAHWEYCTSQYFCTEYRKAAASVLEEATRAIRQARPPQTEKVTTIAQLEALNEKNGWSWFSPGSMRFFGTRIESEVIRGRYFITSEQPPHGSRAYSLRSFNDKGDVYTVGEFCSYPSKGEALAAIPKAEPVAA